MIIDPTARCRLLVEKLTTFELISVIIAATGLVALIWYANETRKIAKATELQGQVLSRPAITIKCSTRRGIHLLEMYSEIKTLIVNHSNVHANMRIKIKAVLHLFGTDEVIEFLAPKPYDGSTWTISSKEEIEDKFRIEGLKRRKLCVGEVLTLLGTIETSPFSGKVDFRADPSFKYIWDLEDRIWVPFPFESD